MSSPNGLTIPVQTTIRVNDDGTCEMIDARYASIDVDTFIRFLLKVFEQQS